MSKLFSFVVGAACLLASTLGLVSAWAEGTAVRVRGTVVSLDGSKLVVHTKDGKDVTVSLKDKYAALAVVKSSMDEIKQGTFIGTATEPQPDGSLRAVEVVVFPDSLRGFAEGHYPWDLGPKSMMTNATIAQKVQKGGRGNRRRHLQGRRKENHHSRQCSNRGAGTRCAQRY